MSSQNSQGGIVKGPDGVGAVVMYRAPINLSRILVFEGWTGWNGGIVKGVEQDVA